VHEAQAVSPPAEKVPARHWVCAVLVGHWFPAAHELQVVWPAPDQLGATQAMGAALLTGQRDPAGHDEHDVAPPRL
jgi:hypothetical protein